MQKSNGQLTQEDIVKDLVQTFPELKPEDIQKKAAQVCSSEKEEKKDCGLLWSDSLC